MIHRSRRQRTKESGGIRWMWMRTRKKMAQGRRSKKR